MKKLYIIALIMFLIAPCVVQARSTSAALGLFKKDELPGFRRYFSNAELSPAGNLILTATDGFMELLPDKQNSTLSDVIYSWSTVLETKLVKDKSFIEVAEPLGGSLWRCSNINTDTAEMVDRWALDQPMGPLGEAVTRGPWFFYGGFNMFIAGTTLNMSVSFRLGTFMLDNKLDTSINMNLGINDVGGMDQTFTDIDLVGRMHFPINEKTSWNIGAQLGSSSAFVGGISFHLPKGLFDMSFNSSSSAMTFGWSSFF